MHIEKNSGLAAMENSGNSPIRPLKTSYGDSMGLWDISNSYFVFTPFD